MDARGADRRGSRRRAKARRWGFERLEEKSLMSAMSVTLDDFDGDGKTDQAIYDQTAAAFYVRLSNPNGPAALNNGNPIYMGNPNHVNIPVVGDYGGNGEATLAIYDQTAAAFYVRLPNGQFLNNGQPIYMGNPAHQNIPIVGDFDDDGKADLAIYDETAGAFYVRLSSTGYTTALNNGNPIYMGNPAHVNIPISGDFDGDGKTDLAIYDENAAAFYVRYSSTNYTTAMNGGQPTYMGDPSHANVPVAGDFDGDGKTDLAIYDSTIGAFYERNSSTNYSTYLNGGQPTYMGSPYQTEFPVVGDFDGDGKTDLILYDENNASFYARLSSTNYGTALNGGNPVQMGNKAHGIIPVGSLIYDPSIGNFV